MPAAPEVLYADCRQRIIEVLCKLKSEDSSHTDGHVTVTAEIKIQLQHIGYGSDPGRYHAEGRILHGKNRVCAGGQCIGYKHFFSKSKNKPLQALRSCFSIRGTMTDLSGNRMILIDRSRKQRRKKGKIKDQIYCVFLYSGSVLIYICKIGNRLKRIKRNSNGKYQFRNRNRQMENGIEGLCCHAGIFISCQHAQICRKCKNKDHLCKPSAAFVF